MGHYGKNLKLLYKILRNEVNHQRFLSEINLNNITEDELNVILLCSAFMKKWELFEELIKQGADLTYSEPNYGFTALHLVAFNGCVDGANFLCQKMNVNIIKKHYSPLHLAALTNNSDVAEVLLNYGARINSLNCGPGYETPLHLAIRSNAFNCVELLAKQGAIIYERGKLSDLSPLFLAIELGRTKCLKIILRYNRDIAAMAKKQFDGNTALHLAALSDQFYCLQILLEYGLNPNIRNNK
ncbi:uncharacterized protein LOC143193672 [Rhynchophorus ferrugineus]|uniref:uncharacterized protein LOC143193672 n=1 Tax=Rhynchophorus ferrugineus TaxID=354439 RepID=UPI003FCDA1BB